MKSTSKLLSFLIALTAILVILSGCGAKKTTYTPFDSNNTQNHANQIDTNLRDRLGTSGNVQVNDDLLKQNLEDLLDQFYANFIEVKNDENKFDTLPKLEAMAKLKMNGDDKFLQLEKAIMEKIESPIALQGRSINQKVAFYLNTYNFLIIRLAYINFYDGNNKITSLLDLSTGLRSQNIFKSKLFVVAGEENLSLKDIEGASGDSILALTGSKDARIPFALYSISKSSPPILNQAYRGQLLEDQLDFITKASLRLKRIFDYDQRGSSAKLATNIFEKYSKIFEEDKSYPGIKRFIQQYIGILIAGKVSFMDHNWALVTSEDSSIPNLDPVVIRPNVDGPCERYKNGGQFKAIAICDRVINGQTSDKYKFNVERSNICIMRIENKKAFRFVGALEEEDEDDKSRREYMDIQTKEKDTKIIDQKPSPGVSQQTIIFQHKEREITEGKTDLMITNNIVTRFELHMSQRFRFWSRDMFKKKKQRSFILSCKPL